MGKKKGTAFGGMTIDFSEQDITMEDLFGDKPIAPSQMMKVLWDHVKQAGLMSKA